MSFSNNCRFAFFFFLSLSTSANAETIRGAHRELDAATPSLIPPVKVDIGSVINQNYAILAKSGISTVPTSVITGNIGVSPIAATAVTGFSLLADSTNQFSTSAQVVGMPASSILEHQSLFSARPHQPLSATLEPKFCRAASTPSARASPSPLTSNSRAQTPISSSFRFRGT
jgi:hypothetical protein